jgi:hypothetical protein
MGFFLVGGDGRGYRATLARMTRELTQGKSGDDACKADRARIRQGTKKPRTMPGLLS